MEHKFTAGSLFSGIGAIYLDVPAMRGDIGVI